jgi:TRAP-type uncharacterized transport system fused permease subunit
LAARLGCLGLRGIPRRERPPFFKTLLAGAHYLIPIVMLLWELIVERHSPELAAFNAIWVMALIMLFQRPAQAIVRREPIGPAITQSMVEIFGALANGARNMVSVTLSLMRPDLIASLIGIPHEQRYWTYLIGLAIYGLIYLMQRPRIPHVETMAAAA